MEEITSRDNPRIRRVCRLMDSKRTREKEGLFCCEGEKLLGEALAAGVEVVQVFLSRDLPLEQQRDRGVPTFLVPPSLMAQMSGVESPQGVLFVCRIPAPRKEPAWCWKMCGTRGMWAPFCARPRPFPCRWC